MPVFVQSQTVDQAQGPAEGAWLHVGLAWEARAQTDRGILTRRKTLEYGCSFFFFPWGIETFLFF